MSIKLDDVQRGYDAWAAKPHNAKWVRKIDGTPIPNDIVVNIFNTLRDLETAPAPPTQMGVVEKCAKIADRFAANNKGSSNPQAFAAYTVASEIARAIRAALASEGQAE